MQRLHVGILKMSTAGYSGVASESTGYYHNPVKEMEDLGALRKENKMGQSPRLLMLTADFGLSTRQLIVKIW